MLYCGFLNPCFLFWVVLILVGTETKNQRASICCKKKHGGRFWRTGPVLLYALLENDFSIGKESVWGRRVSTENNGDRVSSLIKVACTLFSSHTNDPAAFQRLIRKFSFIGISVQLLQDRGASMLKVPWSVKSITPPKTPWKCNVRPEISDSQRTNGMFSWWWNAILLLNLLCVVICFFKCCFSVLFFFVFTISKRQHRLV